MQYSQHEKAQKAYELLEELHALYHNNHVLDQHLTEMFIAYSTDGEPVDKTDVGCSFYMMKEFVRKAEEILKLPEVQTSVPKQKDLREL